jgi:hypothetical protein
VIWSTLAVAVTLGTAPDALTLGNVRLTHGVLGPVRSGDKPQVLPGDSLYVCFDINGIQVDDSGKVQYSTGLEVTGPGGKTILKQDPRNLETTASLGGNRVPGFATINVGSAQPPGEYTLKVTVADRAGGSSATLTKQFEVLPKGFGLVQLAATADAEGLLPVPAPGAGQGLWLHFGAVGFARDKSTKQPKVNISLRVLGADDTPTLANPVAGSITKDVPADAFVLPIRLTLLLNRPGKFTVEIKATDVVAGNETTLTFPLTVVEIK